MAFLGQSLRPFGAATRRVELGRQIRQPVARFQTHRSGGGRASLAGEAVPATQGAVFRHNPLARFQARCEAIQIRRLNHAKSQPTYG